MLERPLRELCERLGWDCRDESLLRQALRHTSYAHEHPDRGPHNQRLEFLGDAVVGLVVAEALYLRYPEAREGELTRCRAAVVSEKPLAEAARDLGIGELLELGKGEEAGGGRSRPSILSDAFEALLGAIFLDGGLDAARRAIENALGQRIREVCRSTPVDEKSRLQERLQASARGDARYRLVHTIGPAHEKLFEVEVLIEGNVYGRGRGSTKKAAEKAAARSALERLDQEESS